jgi:hypothetical protein
MQQLTEAPELRKYVDGTWTAAQTEAFLKAIDAATFRRRLNDDAIGCCDVSASRARRASPGGIRGSRSGVLGRLN